MIFSRTSKSDSQKLAQARTYKRADTGLGPRLKTPLADDFVARRQLDDNTVTKWTVVRPWYVSPVVSVKRREQQMMMTAMTQSQRDVTTNSFVKLILPWNSDTTLGRGDGNECNDVIQSEQFGTSLVRDAAFSSAFSSVDHTTRQDNRQLQTQVDVEFNEVKGVVIKYCIVIISLINMIMSNVYV